MDGKTLIHQFLQARFGKGFSGLGEPLHAFPSQVEEMKTVSLATKTHVPVDVRLRPVALPFEVSGVEDVVHVSGECLRPGEEQLPVEIKVFEVLPHIFL